METVVVPAAGGRRLEGDLRIPADARGVVLFAHGSGSGRHSPRNQLVAATLDQAGFATLLLDLLTAEEEAAEQAGGMLRFDVGLLADRLQAAMDWLRNEPRTRALPLGLFGASTGAAAALLAAAARPDQVGAVVSRGGRPDLAGPALERVRAPTLLIVGGRDPQVLALNRAAQARLGGPVELVVVPGATHLFEEPGALEQVARLARDWFARWLTPDREPASPGRPTGGGPGRPAGGGPGRSAGGGPGRRAGGGAGRRAGGGGPGRHGRP
jgi:putative phosphoribosyl transferase